VSKPPSRHIFTANILPESIADGWNSQPRRSAVPLRYRGFKAVDHPRRRDQSTRLGRATEAVPSLQSRNHADRDLCRRGGQPTADRHRSSTSASAHDRSFLFVRGRRLHRSSKVSEVSLTIFHRRKWQSLRSALASALRNATMSSG
jgi:hypothetical protein